MTPTIVVLGNLLVDDLVFADGRTRMAQAGGAVLYGASAARACGARAGCVSLLGEEYPRAVLATLAGLGVDLSGVHALGRTGVRTWLLYEGHRRQLIHRLGCPTHEEVSPGPAHVPPSWWSASGFHLAPMPLAVQRSLIGALATRAGAFVTVDPHLPITNDTLDAWHGALADADAFFPSEDELWLAGVERDPEAVLPRLASGRLRFVVFKRGVRGGILYDAHERRFHSWAARARDVVDPTGAGDAFAMGFVSAHLEGLPVDACLQRAVVTASFAVASWGPAALMAATSADVETRRQQWFGAEARQP
jgi:cytidine kinase